jgi:hypothetical protein
MKNGERRGSWKKEENGERRELKKIRKKEENEERREISKKKKKKKLRSQICRLF